MWTYILRRLLLMIPTLFGVTVVSFCIMQMAPGDPLRAQMGAGGAMGQSTQTRESYLIQKRDLRLDLPLLVNYNYFRDFAEPVRQAAYFLALDNAQLLAELERLSDAGRADAAAQRRLAFLHGLGIPKLPQRLADPEQRQHLPAAVRYYVQVFCEDTGNQSAPAAIAILQDPQASRQERIGAIQCLNSMVVEPFAYTLSRNPTAAEAAEVEGAWRVWWRRAEPTFPPLDPDRAAALAKVLQEMVDAPSREQLGGLLERLDRDDMRFFVEKLLGDSTLPEKEIAASALRLYIANPLQLDVPPDADDATIERVSENWIAHYELQRAAYNPSLPARVAYFFGDTQYAHMVWRLATFNFGRSAVKTREPVSAKIWDAFIVTAPLMVFAELIIYFVAVPLGVICAVNRGNWIDRWISFKLFLLYSIPAFVAAMLMLVFFAYGDYLKWFPMLGLHSEDADKLGWAAYLLDYAWHAFLPVVCLSLFALASLAMYGRTAMLDVIGQDYVRTARAKGLSSSRVILKHALRNAMIPIITIFAGFLPAMLGGSVLIEYVFGIPGMGRLSWESIELKDYPTVMALIYVDAILVMASILLTDLLYVFVDPRISFDSQD